MESPFPGMDPFLEAPGNWRSFHHHLPEEIMTQLNIKLSERYFADVEVYTPLELQKEVGIVDNVRIYPDAAVIEMRPQRQASTIAVAIPPAPIEREALVAGEVKLRTVYVRETDSKRLVTAIEVLSPYNKRGQGLSDYRLKRERLLDSAVHLIEIDLLRSGERPGWEVQEPPLDTDYVLLVNRATGGRRISEIWPVAINETLPILPVPLLPPDPDTTLDMGEVIAEIYRRAVYGRRIDYTQPIPPPALRPEMGEWWNECQKTQQLI